MPKVVSLWNIVYPQWGHWVCPFEPDPPFLLPLPELPKYVYVFRRPDIILVEKWWTLIFLLNLEEIALHPSAKQNIKFVSEQHKRPTIYDQMNTVRNKIKYLNDSNVILELYNCFCGMLTLNCIISLWSCQITSTQAKTKFLNAYRRHC